MIVGLAGLAGSGKTTVADLLPGRRVSLADPLRAILDAVDPLVGLDPDVGPVRWSHAVAAHGYREAKARWPECRRLLQQLGTEAGRQVLGDDVWVDHLLGGLEPLEAVTVDDVRFPNEVAAIQHAGGVVVWLDRPGLTRMAHASEQLDPRLCDHRIHVIEGSPEATARAVKAVVG